MGEVWVLVRVLPDSCSVLGLFRTAEELHSFFQQRSSQLASSWYPPVPGRKHWCLSDGGTQLVVERCVLPAEQAGELAADREIEARHPPVSRYAVLAG